MRPSTLKSLSSSEIAKLLVETGVFVADNLTALKSQVAIEDNASMLRIEALTLFPEVRNSLVEELATLINSSNCDVLVCTDLRSLLLATDVADVLELPMAFIRKQTKSHGTQRRIEGASISGSRVAIVTALHRSFHELGEFESIIAAQGANLIGTFSLADSRIDAKEAVSSLVRHKDLVHQEQPEEKVEPAKTAAQTLPCRAVPNSASGTKSTAAEILLDLGIFSFMDEVPYRFSSGILSPIYTDNRRLMAHPREWGQIIMELYTGFCKSCAEFDIVVGVATAGVSHAARLSRILNLPLIYSTPTNSGSALTEGTVSKGSRALIVEDLISTGNSALAVAHSLKKCGVQVDSCVSIFSYGMAGATEAFEKNCINLKSLTNISEVLDLLVERDSGRAELRKSTLEWAKDPVEWSKHWESKH